MADEGVSHFFVEHHLIENARSEYAINDGQPVKVDWEEARKYAARGWRSVNEAHGVNSDGLGAARVTVLGRDPDVCEQVWSGDIGYPANGTYLEFHKKFGERRGLRYWKVTTPKSDLGAKDPYYPDDVAAKVHEHATHFCDFVRSRLHDYRRRTGRMGMVAACFDAELFGHWWFEGPRFVRDVMLTLNADPDIDLVTSAELIERYPSDKVVSLPEGSWGDGGDHRVWLNDQVRWMWEVEYRCEALFGKLTYTLPWQANEQLRQMLEKTGRELLLMQASDWPFVIARNQAVDYGIKRFVQHVARFESLGDICEKLAADSAYLGRLTEVEQAEIHDTDIHDVIFPNIDLDWWRM